MEATPEYMFLPGAVKSISQLMPTAKFIALLRNPIDRAFSNYQHNHRKRRTSLTFKEAIWSELEQPTSMPTTILVRDELSHDHTYLAKGYYADQLEVWFQYFPRTQFLILKSEEFFADPQTYFLKACDFVGIGAPSLGTLEFGAHNVGGYQNTIPEDVLFRLEEHFRPHNERLHNLTGISWAS